MGILAIQLGQAGLEGVTPRLCYMNTTDTIAEIITAGYLNSAVQNGYQFKESDMVCVTSQASPGAALAVGWYEVSYSNPNWSLTSSNGAPGSVTLPTIANHIATYTGVGGTLGEDASTAINGGNIQAGLSGTAGYLASFPSTALKGSLRLTAVANTGDTLVTVSNAAHGQATVYSIPDVGAATGGILVSTSALRTKIVAAAAAAGGAAAQSFTDAFCTSASCVVGNWNTQTNAASVLKIVPGNGSFVATSSADAGVGTFNYIIAKA